MAGHVYIAEFENYIKIGVSKVPEKRLHTLEQENKCKATNFYASKNAKNYRYIEKMLHYHFRNKRLYGEYFNVRFKTAVNKIKQFNLIISDDIYVYAKPNFDKENQIATDSKTIGKWGASTAIRFNNTYLKEISCMFEGDEVTVEYLDGEIVINKA